MFLTPSPSDMSTTPSPLYNSIYLNIKNGAPQFPQFVQKMSIDTVDSPANKKAKPGQAVQIITEMSSEHKTTSSICSKVSDQPTKYKVHFNEEQFDEKSKNDLKMKLAQSCQLFNSKIELKRANKIKQSQSNCNISEYKKSNSTDNLIQFVFTKRGIQVISDIETVV